MRSLSTVCLVGAAVLLAGCATRPAPTASAPITAEPAPSPPAEPETPETAAVCGQGSYYADSLAGNPTASGAPYEPTAFTAAHRTLPFGAVLRVTRPGTDLVTTLTVNDRGPFIDGRILDLSRAAAEELDMIRAGVAEICYTPANT